MSLQNLPPELIAQPKKPWLTWVMGFLLLLGTAYWLGGSSTLLKGRSYIARQYAEKAKQQMDQKEWATAYATLTIAASWRVDHPLVLRVTADLLSATGAEPATVLQALMNLQKLGLSTEEDILKMGNIYIQRQDVVSSMTLLKQISPESRERRPALELLANIQRVQGQTQQAERTLRKALEQDKDDHMCQLRLAMLDSQAGFAEIREQAQSVLWKIAAGKDRAAMIAIETLCADSGLTGKQAEALLGFLDQHPDKTPNARLNTISAILKTQPQKREEILNREVEQARDLGESETLPVMLWLLREHEPQRLLSIKRGDLFTKSALLIQPYLQALADLQRWNELDELLTRPAGLSISPASTSLWRAKAAQHLDPENRRTKQHLNIVYEASGHGRDGATALAAATIAEEIGQWDIALLFYEGLAKHQPQSRLQMIEKVQEMAARDRDTSASLRAANRLVEILPENQTYVDRALYLHLVSGDQLEMSLEQISRIDATMAMRLEDHFIRALAAYRLGDLTSLRGHLSHIKDVTALTPGQRAVHAGLLSISGDVGSAYQIAEQIPSILLYREEMHFLKRAL